MNGKRHGDEQVRRAIAKFFNYEYDEFLKLGQQRIDGNFSSTYIGEMGATAGIYAEIKDSHGVCGRDIKNKKLEKPRGLIGGFEHHEIAIELNRVALDIEKIDGKIGHPSYNAKSSLQSFGKNSFKCGMIKKSVRYF